MSSGLCGCRSTTTPRRPAGALQVGISLRDSLPRRPAVRLALPRHAPRTSRCAALALPSCCCRGVRITGKMGLWGMGSLLPALRHE